MSLEFPPAPTAPAERKPVPPVTRISVQCKAGYNIDVVARLCALPLGKLNIRHDPRRLLLLRFRAVAVRIAQTAVRISAARRVALIRAARLAARPANALVRASAHVALFLMRAADNNHRSERDHCNHFFHALLTPFQVRSST